MWVRRALALVAVALALAVVPAQAATPAEQARVIQLVNDARAQQGLGPVVVSAQLTASGESYAAYLAAANFFSHVGLNGSTMPGRDEAAGYLGWSFLAENIAAGQTSADSVFQAWMSSPGHRANILDARVREIGIGHAYSATATYGNYWTMELGARPGANLSAPSAIPAPTSRPAPTATATPRPVTYPVQAAGRYRTTIPFTSR